MSKTGKKFLTALMSSVVLFTFIGNVWAGGQSEGEKEEQKEINVLAFSGYEEPGMMEPFEKETGIKVNLKVHDGTDDEMVAMIKTSKPGTWDIMTPTSAYVPELAQQGHLMELNPENYPLDKFMSPFDKWPFTWVDNKLYGIVNRFGYYGLTYNYNKLSEDEVQSYDILFDEKLEGRVALFDWFLPNIGIIALYLGYDNPYDLNSQQLEEVKQKLFELKPQVGLIGGTAQVTQALASGEYWATFAGEWVQAGLYDDGHPYYATIPKEGGVTWDQAVVVLENSPRKESAKKFLQYVSSPEFQAKLATAQTYYSMVPHIEAAKLLSEKEREILNLENPEKFEEEYLSRLTPRDRPDNIEEYQQVWEEFKAK